MEPRYLGPVEPFYVVINLMAKIEYILNIEKVRRENKKIEKLGLPPKK